MGDSDDEEDLWAGLEDDDSKISVSSNLLEVRITPRRIGGLTSPSIGSALHNDTAHPYLLTPLTCTPLSHPSRGSCSDDQRRRQWCTRVMRTRDE